MRGKARARMCFAVVFIESQERDFISREFRGSSMKQQSLGATAYTTRMFHSEVPMFQYRVALIVTSREIWRRYEKFGSFKSEQKKRKGVNSCTRSGQVCSIRFRRLASTRVTSQYMSYLGAARR